MSDKLTNDEVFDVLAINGIDAIVNYMNGSSIEDSFAGRLWDEARESTERLVTYLEDSTGRSLDDE